MPSSVVKTHISILILTDDLVFKFKRAVRLPFLDLSTSEARRRACEAEVAGNRRLSPDVYLGVADVQLAGDVLEHVVVMRRLPADRSLTSLVKAEGSLTEAEITALARRLAAFHQEADRSEQINDDARPEAVAALWRATIEGLRQSADAILASPVIAEVEELGTGFLSGRTALFDQRVKDGFVCDGHGDLLADDVYMLDDGPRLLDCIDFDERLRHVDVAADLAFLYMDLEHHGALLVAEMLRSRYEEAAASKIPDALFRYYCAQRALVRAQVACLRASEAPEPSASQDAIEARELLDLAVRYLRAAAPRLVVLSGPPGTGKSTVARDAGRILGWPVLSSDQIRHDLVDPNGLGPLLEAQHPGIYDPEVTRATYRTLLERAGEELAHGQSVILDATFTDEANRLAVASLARATSSTFVAFALHAPDWAMSRRVRARLAHASDMSGADEHVALTLNEATKPWTGATALDSGAHSARSLVERVVAAVGGEGLRQPDLVSR